MAERPPGAPPEATSGSVGALETLDVTRLWETDPARRPSTSAVSISVSAVDFCQLKWTV